MRAPTIPANLEPELVKYLRDLELYYSRELTGKLSARTASASVFLQSPANKVFEVTVDDAGALTTTLVRQ